MNETLQPRRVVTAVGGTLKIAANTVTDGKLVVVAECKEVAIDGAAPPSDVAFVLANGTIDSIHKGVPPGTSVARTGDKGEEQSPALLGGSTKPTRALRYQSSARRALPAAGRDLVAVAASLRPQLFETTIYSEGRRLLWD